MPWVIPTKKAGATFGSTGKFFYTNPQGSEFVEVPLPTGVNATDTRPCEATFNFDAKSRQYYTGGWTDNLVFTEHFGLMRLGIIAPPNPIISGAGAGNSIGVTPSGTGITGNAVCYVRWWDDINQRASPLSGPSPVIALANQGRAWSNLPTNPRDPSVTHIDLFVAMSGDSPRFAVRRDLGTTAVTENIATGALGEAITEDVERFQRCRWNVVWHDRHVLAGDDRHPERLYLSPIEDPENLSFYIRTRRGEKITGIIPFRDQLVVLCSNSSYIVEGYTEDDIKMDILEPKIGGIGHHLVALVDGWAIVPSHRGIYLCTGTSFHLISKHFQHTWKRNLPDPEVAWAVNDISQNTYKLFHGAAGDIDIPEIAADITSAQSVYWCLDYTNLMSETGGGFEQPSLSLDVRTRHDECAAVLNNPGSPVGTLYTGSCDGTVRRDDEDNNDDDGDAFEKKLVIQTRHDFFGNPGGAPDDGNKFPTAWDFMEADNNAYVVTNFAGDEKAWEDEDPADEEVPAGLRTDGLNTLVTKCVHYWEPMNSGRGCTRKYVMLAPDKTVRWSGYGGSRIPGEGDSFGVKEGPVG